MTNKTKEQGLNYVNLGGLDLYNIHNVSGIILSFSKVSCRKIYTQTQLRDEFVIRITCTFKSLKLKIQHVSLRN